MICVVDDGEEHVHHHEEDDKHERAEVNRPKDAVGHLNRNKVEVAENNAEQCKTVGEEEWVGISRCNL